MQHARSAFVGSVGIGNIGFGLCQFVLIIVRKCVGTPLNGLVLECSDPMSV